MIRLVSSFILLFPSLAFAEIVGEDIIAHSASLFIGALACAMMILGYVMNKF